MHKLICAACIALFATTVDAKPFYVGATLGESVGESSPPRAVDEFDLDASWRILAGWKFTDSLAIEASYHDFGDASGAVSPCETLCTPDIPVDIRASSDAWTLRATYLFGDQQWQPFAALGWTWRNTDGSVRGLGSGVRVGFDDSDDGLSAELGARVRLAGGFSLRAGYEWFDFENASDGALNVGAEYSF